jgi:hypothetical protein
MWFWSLVDNSTNATANESILFISTARAVEIEPTSTLEDFNNTCMLAAYA